MFALVAVLAVRLLTLPIALAGAGLQTAEYAAAAWFGPKGFASVVYGLIILQSTVPDAALVFQSIALAATVSMVLHSSTDVAIAEWFRARERGDWLRDSAAAERGWPAARVRGTTTGMLSVLSPAKTLDHDSPLPTRKHSQPRMLDRSEMLVDVLVRKSPDELAALMDISDDLAELNAKRFADFTIPFDTYNARPAVLAFQGDVYQGMNAGTFGERDFTEAQKTVRILSGLYGVLRPLDLMQPYRLEMGTRLKTDRGGTLYEFWGDHITEMLNADLCASPGPDALINLASEEYFRAVRVDQIDGRVISPRFLDVRDDGEYRVISFYAKRARGAMAGWLVRNRVRTIKGIRDFDGLGYRYDPERSTSDEPTFLRDSTFLRD